MRIEKKLLKVSLLEMVQISLTALTLIIFFAYVIFTVILKSPFVEIFQKVGMIFILVPLTQGIIQPLINRTVLLTIESNEKSEAIRRKIDELLIHLKYRETKRNDNFTFYDYNTKWKRIINSPFNMDVKIAIDKESIRIYGKNITLNQIESKLYQDKELRD